jgi:uncharacterized protein
VILVDTGPLVAIALPADPDHGACERLRKQRGGEFAVPAPVVTETCYMLNTRLGAEAEAAFLELFALGDLRCIDLLPQDYQRAADLVRQYADQPLGTVDASVVAVAERLGVREIATLDARHFNVVRPRHVDHFTLLP